MGKKELAHIMKAIKRVREPGEQPIQSATDIDVYECDLCKGDTEKQHITQCTYCGRWICKKHCWHVQHLSCNACASVIALVQHHDDNNTDTSTKEDQKESFLDEPLRSIRNLISKKKD